MYLAKQLLRQPAKSHLKTLQRLLSASVVDGHLVVIQEDNGKTLKFPGVWLRDNCQCAECFHDQTKSKINWDRSKLGVRVEGVSTANETTSSVAKHVISLDWSDKHKSTFDLAWLRERDFSPENRQRYLEEVYKPTPELWNKDDFVKVSKTFEFADVASNDEALLAWLQALAVQGFALIKNAPKDEGVVRQLANRIGFIKRTTYGEEFEVKSKDDARNYAYLATPLPLHTDMPYYEYKAGINILHTLVQSQSQGGANLITDGFSVAEKLRQSVPELYETLKRTPVDWFDIGQDSGMAFHSIWRSPMICLDVDGRYHRINQNINKRDSHFNVPLEQVGPWYQAYYKFLELANAQAVEFKTVPGDVFTFNNLRMLHGRTAYEDSAANRRHLVGAYVDWDLIYSKMRILKMQKH